MMRNRLFPLLAVIAALFLAGLSSACGAHQDADDESLMGSVRNYAEAILWQKHEAAAIHRAPLFREEFLAKREELEEDLRVVEYQLQRVKEGQRGNKIAVVLLKFRWHLDSEGIVRTSTVEQHWEKKNRQWILTTEFLARGTDMPGLDTPPKGREPTDDDDAADPSEVPSGGADAPAAAE